MLNNVHNNKLTFTGLFLALVGISDTTYLTYTHYTGGSLACNLLEGCEVVTTSAYSTIAGIPMALLGLLFYLVVFFTFIYYYDKAGYKTAKFLVYVTGLGFAFSLWLLYLQAFVINAYCQFCLLSLITSTLLFFVATFLYKTATTSAE